MGDNQRFMFTLVAIAALAFSLFVATKHVEAFSVANARILTLDEQTLDRGFTVKSYDEKFWLPIFPNTYSKPIEVKVETLNYGHAIPEKKTAVSHFYTYSVKTGAAGFLAKPAVIAVHYNSRSLTHKVIYYYDKSKASWRPLPSVNKPELGIVVAKTPFPYAEVIVLEETFSDTLTADSAIVATMDGTILFEKNPNEVRPIASLTKLVTAMVFLDHNPGWRAQVTIKETDNVGGASLPLEPGDTIAVRDLFFATLVGSKNNAARALMRSTGLTERAFVAAMNHKVKSWGLEKTSFEEPTGLSEFNVSTASEMLKIAQKTFNVFKFLEATTLKWYKVVYSRDGESLEYWVKNTNKLLDRDLYVTGGKTGYTHEAGYNLVTKAKKDGHEIIALVLGAEIRQNYEEVYILLKKYLP